MSRCRPNCRIDSLLTGGFTNEEDFLNARREIGALSDVGRIHIESDNGFESSVRCTHYGTGFELSAPDKAYRGFFRRDFRGAGQ